MSGANVLNPQEQLKLLDAIQKQGKGIFFNEFDEISAFDQERRLDQETDRGAGE